MFHFLFIGFGLTMGIGLAILVLINLNSIIYKIRLSMRSALITMRSVFCTALTIFGIAGICVAFTDDSHTWTQSLPPLGGAIMMTGLGIFWGLNRKH